MHPFFKGINWAKLAARDVDPPFKPNVREIESFDLVVWDQVFGGLPIALLVPVCIFFLSENTPDCPLPLESDRVLLGMFEYLRAENTRSDPVLGLAGAVLPEIRVEVCTSVHKYQNRPRSVRSGSNFCVDSESAIERAGATVHVITPHGTRMCNLGQRAQLDIPGSPDQSNQIFEGTIKL